MVGISKALALAASVASVQAFVRPAPLAQQSAVARRAGRIEMQTLDGMIGSSAPFKNFDPLGFARKANAATLAKYRESELKHGRVAMLATVGWFFQEKFHPLYDGKLSANPLEAAKQVPVLGWVQILLAIHIIEYVSAQISKLPGARPGDYLGTWEWVEKSDEGWDTYQTKELNNGRLAMMAISGLIVQDLLTGQAGHEQIASTFFK